MGKTPHVTVHIKSEKTTGSFTLTTQTSFAKLKKVWCEQNGLRESEVVLRLDGADLAEEGTPESRQFPLGLVLEVEAVLIADMQLSFDDRGADPPNEDEGEEEPRKRRRRGVIPPEARALPDEFEFRALERAVLARERFQMRPVDQKGSLAAFIPHFTDFDTSLGLFSELRAWTTGQLTPSGKKHAEPRLRFAVGQDITYRGTTISGLPWSNFPRLAEAKTQTEELLEGRFNSVLIKLYRDGQDKVSLHREIETDDSTTIASLSLGRTRVFLFKESKEGGETCKLSVKNGDLLVMAGKFQKNLLHGVPRSARCTGERIHATFRNFEPEQTQKKDTKEKEESTEDDQKEVVPMPQRRRFPGKLLDEGDALAALDSHSEASHSNVPDLHTGLPVFLSSRKHSPTGTEGGKGNRGLVGAEAEQRKREEEEQKSLSAADVGTAARADEKCVAARPASIEDADRKEAMHQEWGHTAERALEVAQRRVLVLQEDLKRAREQEAEATRALDAQREAWSKMEAERAN